MSEVDGASNILHIAMLLSDDMVKFRDRDEGQA